MVNVQMADKDFVQIVIGNLLSGDSLVCPGPYVEEKLVAILPSSTRKQAAACFGRTDGWPVPSAVIRISSGSLYVLDGDSPNTQLCLEVRTCATAESSP